MSHIFEGTSHVKMILGSVGIFSMKPAFISRPISSLWSRINHEEIRGWRKESIIRQNCAYFKIGLHVSIIVPLFSSIIVHLPGINRKRYFPQNFFLGKIFFGCLSIRRQVKNCLRLMPVPRTSLTFFHLLFLSPIHHSQSVLDLS